MNTAELEKKIHEQVKIINDKGGIYLFCFLSELIHELSIMILKELTKKYKLNGVYITLGLGCSFLEEHLKKNEELVLTIFLREHQNPSPFEKDDPNYASSLMDLLLSIGRLNKWNL